MNDTELDRRLRQARPPARPEAYWRSFPNRIMARLGGGARPREERPSTVSVPTWWKPRVAFGSLGLAALVLVIGLALLTGTNRKVFVSEARLNAMQHCVSEMRALFPNQVQAIVFDAANAQVVLADGAVMPDSAALYLKICGADDCREIVSFSGSQVPVDGELYEVLVSGSGSILLVGPNIQWSSSAPTKGAGRYRIAARALGASKG